jgi:hypothetical protein
MRYAKLANAATSTRMLKYFIKRAWESALAAAMNAGGNK